MDDRFRPYFFVRAADATRSRRVAPGSRVVELTLLGRSPASRSLRVEVDLPGDVPPLRARLGEAGVECFEADVRFAYRYLIDHGIRGAFVVDGPFERRPGVGRVYRNPRARAGRLRRRALRVLSFDIETSLDGRFLYSIAAAGARRRPRVDGSLRRVRTAGRPPRGRDRAAGAERARAASQAFLAHSARPIPTCSRAGTSATST